MGFEDLVTQKKAVIKNSNNKKHCPHCGTRHILTYLVQGVVGGERRQKAHCPSCNKWWYIVYDADIIEAHIELLTSDPSAGGI